MKKTEKQSRSKETTVAEAKEHLLRAFVEASPARYVESHPLKAVATAAVAGALVGYSDDAMRGLSATVNTALLSSGTIVSSGLNILRAISKF